MATFGTNPPAAAETGPAATPSVWFTIEGAVLIVLGLLAFIAPFTAARRRRACWAC